VFKKKKKIPDVLKLVQMGAKWVRMGAKWLQMGAKWVQTIRIQITINNLYTGWDLPGGWRGDVTLTSNRLYVAFDQ
jgi:hypothetical protein